jgi:hypothetical protein
MNELLAIGIVLGYMAIAYFLVYPKAKKGCNPTLVGSGVLAVGVSHRGSLLLGE